MRAKITHTLPDINDMSRQTFKKQQEVPAFFVVYFGKGIEEIESSIRKKNTDMNVIHH